jgi:O-antigen/teichoic acid export membrane protein
LLKPEAGIWRYVFGTQLASTLDLPATHLPVLVVGGVLGPSAAGLYRIANEFASVLLKPGAKLFGRAIYPDLARLLAQNEILALRKMVVRTGALAGALSLFVFGLFVVFGREIIVLSAGGEFLGAYETMIWLCLAGVVSMFGFGLEPLLISAGRIRETVMARGLATVAFIPALAILLQQYGIAGAGIAGLVYSVLMVVFMALSGRCLLKEQVSG